MPAFTASTLLLAKVCCILILIHRSSDIGVNYMQAILAFW